MRESKIEKRLTDLAKKHNFLAWKFKSTRKGVPDRIVVHDGAVYLVELKNEVGELEPMQLRARELLLGQNVMAYTLGSIDAVNCWVRKMLKGDLK